MASHQPFHSRLISFQSSLPFRLVALYFLVTLLVSPYRAQDRSPPSYPSNASVEVETLAFPAVSAAPDNPASGNVTSPRPTVSTEAWLPSNLDVELDNALFYSADDPGGTGIVLPTLAEPCNRTACQLPNCYCDATVIPGGLAANETPQILLIAFDGAVNMHNYDLYMQMFHEERRNPNGCPVRATFYLSHRWTDYSHVQNLYAVGHEIALRGVALTGDEPNATYENFVEDIVALQQIAKNFADVNPEDIVGMRAPYLKTEGDDEFLAAFDSRLLYDSSILNPSMKPVWPFTLDYATPFTCPEWYPRCPLLAYPGLWELPVTRLVGPAGVPYGFFTAYEFSKNPIEIADILMKFFLTHYTTNRAPFTLNGLSYWFATPEYRLGYELFLEQVLRLPDVWLLTGTQLVHWMRQPTATSELHHFEPFKCDKKRDVELCQTPRSCRTFLEGEEIYFTSCKRCPYTFPYLKNFNGCFNEPCPVPVVEYVDAAVGLSSSLCKVVLHLFIASRLFYCF